MSDLNREMNPSTDDFAALLNESFENEDSYEGSVVKGKVVAIEKDFAVIDVGMKMEGRVAMKEFGVARHAGRTQGRRHRRGLPGARRECARRSRAVARQGTPRRKLGHASKSSSTTSEQVTGVIFNKVKGGFTVDLDGAVAFLPGSQVDVRPVRDIGPLMHSPQPFKILKMDRRRGNIVVSRREILEVTRAEQRTEIVAQARRRPGHRRRGQEHHRLRRLHRPRRHRRPAARHRHGLAPRQSSLAKSSTSAIT